MFISSLLVQIIMNKDKVIQMKDEIKDEQPEYSWSANVGEIVGGEIVEKRSMNTQWGQREALVVRTEDHQRVIVWMTADLRNKLANAEVKDLVAIKRCENYGKMRKFVVALEKHTELATS